MIERLHPGVYVTEIAFQAKPIDGISTSTAPFSPAQAATHEAVVAPTPDWTQRNHGDPGVTLLQLFAFLRESLLFREPAIASIAHAQPGYGIAQGLAVGAGDGSSAAELEVSRGFALASDGQILEPDTTRSAHRIRKP